MVTFNPLSWLRRGQQRLTLKDPVGWGAGSSTRSAVPVNFDTALQVSALLCAARVIAEGVSQIPLKLYTETDNPDGVSVRKPARKDPLYDLLASSPCWLTSFEFREVLTLQAAVTGNAFAWINRGSDGRPRELLPIAPDSVTVELLPNFEVQYRVASVPGAIDRKNIFHLRGPSRDGLIGERIYNLAREAIGLSKALEWSHADLFGRGARPSGTLQTAANLSEEQTERVRASWMKRFGPGGDGGVAILDGKWDYKSIVMSAVDAQFIETRRFQIEEIARSMRVFPQMLMHSDKTSTFASASEFFRAHVIHTLGPWIARWEDALKRDVVGVDGKSKDLWPRFSTDGLLRGDPRERAQLYKEYIMLGVMSPNEVREMENLNPREGGDEYLTPLNMRQGSGEGGASGA
jgi:HK97 family phage portal protein